jgi:hypothetical protein
MSAKIIFVSRAAAQPASGQDFHTIVFIFLDTTID